MTLRRRDFITLLGGAAAAWPVAARAQQPLMPVIGFLTAHSLEATAQLLSRIKQGLAETGFVELRNVRFEYRWANGQYDRLPALAMDLVGQQPAVILTYPAVATLRGKAATTTIPIVFTIGGDPVEQLGLVASYNKPGGNMTGVTSFTAELWGKRLEIMRELVPLASVIAVLTNPKSAGVQRATKDVPEAGRLLGLQTLILSASTEQEIDSAFASLVQRGARALLIQADPFLSDHRNQIVTLAAQHSIPACFPLPEDSIAGGLVSYGTSRANRADLDRQMGIYAGRILKGERPGDLPILQPTKFELVINLKTAKTLGLRISDSFLLRADEVIE
jgi:putative ABC transport system substrate-binding protein